jgi:hypothetical protein
MKVWRLVAAFLTCLVFLGLFTTRKLKASWDHLKKKAKVPRDEAR